MTFNSDIFDQLVKPEESSRLVVYDDANGKPIVPGSIVVGHPTIGIGRCLDTNGISENEQAMLYDNDRDTVFIQLLQGLPWIASLDEVRTSVLCAMAFQIGTPGLLEFKGTLAAVQAANWQEAHDHMMDSEWAEQTPARAQRMADIMLNGNVPTTTTT